jgi:hypothetical protein
LILPPEPSADRKAAARVAPASGPRVPLVAAGATNPRLRGPARDPFSTVCGSFPAGRDCAPAVRALNRPVPAMCDADHNNICWETGAVNISRVMQPLDDAPFLLELHVCDDC